MSDAVQIAAETRTEFGKGAARRTRRDNKVPAVLYGHGEDPRHVALPGHELMLALKGGANTLLELQLDGGDTQLALPRMVVRDPIKGFFIHLDLLVLRKGERVTVEVPITVNGEAGPDTLVDQQTTTLTVETDAISIPSGFEVSVEGMTAGDRVTAADVDLPKGVELQQDPESIIVQVLTAVLAEPEEGEEAPEGDVVPEIGSEAAAEGDSEA